MWGCDSGAGQGASPAGPCASTGSHPRGNPVPPSDAPFGDATVQARIRTRSGPALHPAPGSHPSGKPDGTCSALRGRASGRGRRVAGLHKEEPTQASAQSAPVPRRRRIFIGLCQVRRLHRCAPRQGTYLGFVATPRIHPHLTQRASRNLIRASLASSDLPPSDRQTLLAEVRRCGFRPGCRRARSCAR